MARPAKSRRVCRLPLCQEFYGGKGNDSGITLTVEEYETIRLIDYMGFSQEECGRQMGGPGRRYRLYIRKHGKNWLVF